MTSPPPAAQPPSVYVISSDGPDREAQLDEDYDSGATRSNTPMSGLTSHSYASGNENAVYADLPRNRASSVAPQPGSDAHEDQTHSETQDEIQLRLRTAHLELVGLSLSSYREGNKGDKIPKDKADNMRSALRSMFKGYIKHSQKSQDIGKDIVVVDFAQIAKDMAQKGVTKSVLEKYRVIWSHQSGKLGDWQVFLRDILDGEEAKGTVLKRLEAHSEDLLDPTHWAYEEIQRHIKARSDLIIDYYGQTGALPTMVTANRGALQDLFALFVENDDRYHANNYATWYNFQWVVHSDRDGPWRSYDICRLVTEEADKRVDKWLVRQQNVNGARQEQEQGEQHELTLQVLRGTVDRNHQILQSTTDLVYAAVRLRRAAAQEASVDTLLRKLPKGLHSSKLDIDKTREQDWHPVQKIYEHLNTDLLREGASIIALVDRIAHSYPLLELHDAPPARANAGIASPEYGLYRVEENWKLPDSVKQEMKDKIRKAFADAAEQANVSPNSSQEVANDYKKKMDSRSFNLDTLPAMGLKPVVAECSSLDPAAPAVAVAAKVVQNLFATKRLNYSTHVLAFGAAQLLFNASRIRHSCDETLLQRIPELGRRLQAWVILACRIRHTASLMLLFVADMDALYSRVIASLENNVIKAKLYLLFDYVAHEAQVMMFTICLRTTSGWKVQTGLVKNALRQYKVGDLGASYNPLWMRAILQLQYYLSDHLGSESALYWDPSQKRSTATYRFVSVATIWNRSPSWHQQAIGIFDGAMSGCLVNILNTTYFEEGALAWSTISYLLSRGDVHLRGKPLLTRCTADAVATRVLEEAEELGLETDFMAQATAEAVVDALAESDVEDDVSEVGRDTVERNDEGLEP